ncbi:MAG TPA: redoxin domain-containing protein [Candidatus Stackebrandtia faecavium]|nr:redoxin domain-containing protein [Candidatus Stackebrandtia faecavium]
MAIIITLIAILTVVALLNLLLTLGLIKRFREVDQIVADLNAVEHEPMLPTGSAIDEFEAETVDSETITHASLTEGTIVGFFNPTCETCHGHIPTFSEVAASLPDGRNQALAVVQHNDDPDELDEMVTPLSKAARVVVQPKRGTVWRAFGVQATPAFCQLGRDQLIAKHGYS